MDRVFFILPIALLMVLGCNRDSSKEEEMNRGEIEAIETTIVNSYIHGVHETQDSGMVKVGFHKDFAMLVSEENGDLRKVSVDEWLNFINNTAKVQSPELWKTKATYRLEFLDVTGSAASVKLEVYKGDKHFSTDYMLLYKSRDGWKIVSKIFKLW